MSDDYGTTNPARAARESADRLRGELPNAPAGSVAEQFGYAATGGAETMGDQRPGTSSRAREEQDWLQWRRTGVGAGDIATLMGWGFAGSSPYKKWAEVIGLIPPGSSDDNEEFEYGHRAEAMLCDWFEDRTDLHVAHQQERRQSAELDIAIATIDGEVYEVPPPRFGAQYEDEEQLEPLGGVEFKTAGPHGWRVDDPIPDMYVCQGQWQMFVCGWQRLWFAVLHERKFRIYELERDDDDIAVLREVAEHFWNTYVLTGEPPPLDASPATRTAIARAYPGHPEKTTTILPELRGTLDRLREAKAMRDQWATTVTELENGVKVAMGDNTYLSVGDGVTVATWSRFNRTTVDGKALKSQHPDIYKEVTRSSPSSRFVVTGTREEDD